MLGKKKDIKIYLATIILMIFTIGCISMTGGDAIINNTYKVLKTTQIGYDNSMKIIASLHKQGKITNEQKNKVIDLGNDFVEAYKIATLALEMYAEGNMSNVKVSESFDKFIQIQNRFVNLIREIVSNEI